MSCSLFVNAQNTTTPAPTTDTSVKNKVDTSIKPTTDTTKPMIDSAALAKKITDSIAAAKLTQNCYAKWYDYMSTHGAKTVADGMQKVVVAFKSGDACHCFMGKIEVAGGKIKAPLYIQEEDGEYKTFSEFGKKLDAEFVSTMGADLWKINDGMSTLFRTTEQEYGRIFFYEFANKGGKSKKEAPSPEELIKQD
jgi:hypothetical protein